MSDASYREPAFSDRPLRLTAVTAEDLAVISALLQDAVGRTGEVCWMPRRRRLAAIVNRFRWEDAPAAERERRPYERVRALVLFDGVLSVRARGVDPADRQAALAILAMKFVPDAEGVGGRIDLTLAGGGEVAIEIECIEIRLQDLTRPWEARSRRAPDHRLDEAG